MYKKLIMSLIASMMVFSLLGQNSQKLPMGFPDRSPKLDILPGFKNPPKGYGEVSFYWWIGDTLTKERIRWQLDQLKDKSITGLQINYCHTDKGSPTYGLPYPSRPALFSPEWWKLFQWFMKEAKKRDMSVSLSDYTLGVPGQGWYIDEMLKENPQLYGTKLQSTFFEIGGNQYLAKDVPENILSATAYQNVKGTLSSTNSIDIKPLIRNSVLRWHVPSGNWKIVIVNGTIVKLSIDPMNPLSGEKVAKKFYQRFENHCPGESGKGLNFFFSDELVFGIRGFLWNDAFADEFKKEKGYDILPELASLFTDLGPRSYKIRLDYNDVMVTLTEKGFFKPVYDWHSKRGMLFGCDHGGRGTDVTEFGDYFRTQRWTSGPGCDQAELQRDIVKAKVASSIGHLYERPRTWLEGYHSSGWGTSCEEVADATFANFAMGHNLLSLHGLYYTTHGSWWEWAAPDNHFRQPYWDNMGSFLKCSERLSYVLSQGHHRCDVAIVYPVAPVEARLKGQESVATAFTLANDLYPSGIDFDFMDFQSLNRCSVQDKELNVSGEKYKVLVLPSLSAVRYSTIEKAFEFFNSGGIVIAVGALPEASDRIGGNDEKLQSMIIQMFGTTYSEKHDTTKVYSLKSKTGGYGAFIHNPLEVKNLINNLIQPDFKILSGNFASSILHRKVGERDLYFVYGVPKGTECFFRSLGKTELWNPWNGTTVTLKVASVSDKGTVIKLPLEKNEPQLIIFSSGKAEIEKAEIVSQKKDTLAIDNNWEFELKPTLDNKYGDFRLPAFEGKIGVEVWNLKYAAETDSATKRQAVDLDDQNWVSEAVSYGQQFWKLGPLPASANPAVVEAELSSMKQIDSQQPVEIDGRKYYWQPYEFSWRWGLKNDAGHQGYHGLKGQINNELIALGKMDKSKRAKPVYPLSQEDEGAVYYLWSTVMSPRQMTASVSKAGLLPAKVWLNRTPLQNSREEAELETGNNPLLLKYDKPGRGYFLFKDGQVKTTSKPGISLATDWYLNSSVLPLNCLPQLEGKFGWYRLMAPPGARSMVVQSISKPKVWISGNETQCQQVQPVPERFADKNLPVWNIVFPDTLLNASLVALRIQLLPGFYNGAAIPEPIVFNCGKGKIQLGDLGKNESLKTYSGGMWYRKTLNISQEQANAVGATLDLGWLVASAEVIINGKSVGSKVSSPWRFDLSGKLVQGENRIEILIYNTLGNHYLTTPSMYIGRTSSGLIGPVKMEFEYKVTN